MKMISRIFLVLLLGSIPVLPYSRASEGEDGAEEGFHKNHMSLFLGSTQEGSEESFTIGLDYEYRIRKHLGIGAFADYAGGDIRSTAFGVPLGVHPTVDWILFAGPGLDHHEGENDFLVRIGTMYHFEVGKWTIAPALNLDIVDGDELWVYGVNIGRGF